VSPFDRSLLKVALVWVLGWTGAYRWAVHYLDQRDWSDT
jgi:hypothetical protein